MRLGLMKNQALARKYHCQARNNKQISIFDKYPNRAGYKRRGTSSDDARKIGNSNATHDKILALLRQKPMTADEVADALKRPVLYVRPRFSEMVAKGLICETGERRKNESGLSAAVWCPL